MRLPEVVSSILPHLLLLQIILSCQRRIKAFQIHRQPRFPRTRSYLPTIPSPRTRLTPLADRKNGNHFEKNQDGDSDEREIQRSGGDGRNTRRRIPVDNLGDSRDPSELNVPSSYGRRDGWSESLSKAILAGVFVLGIALGVTVDSQVNTNPRDLASRDAIDKAAPNPTICSKFGASAMAFDQRVFVSFNPFNVYVSQADVKPACVLREANIVPVLRSRNLINDEQVRMCKQNMNTWAFVGDLDHNPQLSCVYKSHDAQNEFLSNPKVGLGEDYMDGRKQLGKTITNKAATQPIESSQSQSKLGVGNKDTSHRSS